MLKSVKNALKGVLAWVVIALLVLSFAAWQVPEMRNFAQNSALRVGDRGFSAAEIRTELNREVANRRQEADGGYTYADAVAEGLPGQVVQQMASRAALEQQAEALGLAMPRDLVREILNADERFQDPATGEFNTTVLQAVLQFYNMSVQQFEQLMRGEFLRGQLISAIASGPGAPSTVAEAVLLRDIESREITYAIVDETLAEKAATPSEEDLRNYHASNPEQFTAPEYRTLTYAALRLEDFEDRDSISEERLREVYDGNRERLYETPEQRTLYQIRFDTEGEAQAAVAQLAAGQPFEAIAAAKGQSLDSVTYEDVAAGDLVDPNVREAAFAADLEPGEYAGPIQGLFGFAVVQVVDMTPPTTRAFDEVADEIRTALLENETRKALYDAVEAIENQRDTGASLSEAARAAGVEPATAGPVDAFSFGPGGEVVAEVPGDVLKEGFDLDEGAESVAVEFEDDSGYFFVAVNEVIPSTLRPYEDVAEDVRRAWVRADKTRRIATAAEKLRTAALEGDLAASAAVAGAKVETLTVNRGRLPAADLSEGLNEELFLARVGEIIQGAAAAPDALALVEVRGARHDLSRINPGQAQMLRQYLTFQMDQELFDAYVAAVRDDLGVRTDASAIDAIVSEGG
ncbi:MAG: hypothetical protein GC152_09145 [Alphaproteobacteria bacterium]|nr:hypothetical protein [Alphaproteobacteria bacterium]